VATGLITAFVAIGVAQLVAGFTGPQFAPGPLRELVDRIGTQDSPHPLETAFEQWFSQSWTSGLAQDTLQHRVQKSSQALQWVWKLPLTAYPLFDAGNSEGLATYFVDWLKHPSYDSYWKEWSIEESYSKIKVPAYHVGGWYDIFMGGTVRNYVGIKSAGGNDTARMGQRLLLGPWYHGPFDGKSGDIDFGAEAKGNTTT
jgi:predicted acyl esterase